ncbi:DNA repair protein RadA/Sms [Ardenticatena maritima]|uniref:DNA repair protein RadA n=1 Tax=Ardenticatena maritima TaxID=872965 RepID=A0A0N0RFU1_9CHLR|nr:DNA repair protein RadA [Ardenticatena maritima]KPL88256.1 DNA repair protein RadA [Ardenticatena maritima]GAP63734.1 DNA repair protein RadA/Sms [Ardenticatena maritima]
MARKKARTVYVCEECGAEHPKWGGRCLTCGAYNSLKEFKIAPEPSTRHTAQTWLGASDNPPRRLTEVEAEAMQRIPLTNREFARVLGGGIVPGSLVLIGGDPGIGKSTLLLQVAGELAERQGVVLYVSGEESTHQIRMRAERLGIHAADLYLLSETNLERIVAHIQHLHPRAVIVDSIQTVYLDSLASSAGSVTQVRECAARLLQTAKILNIPIFLVGHVTKSGDIAGPRVLEHIVDAVLYLEGDRLHAYRLLRSVKNRFGSTHEVGVFEMAERGMLEVANPSELFLGDHRADPTGAAIAVTLEGTRALLVEIQALSTTTAFSQPRRTATGFDLNRLYLLIAVLTKRVGLKLHNQDIFVNVVGGLRIAEPAADLAVALAIASSYREKPISRRMAAIGEIGLGGELRPVGQLEKRLSEAAKLGFTHCLVPKTSRPVRAEGIHVIPCGTVVEALHAAFKSGQHA